MTKRRPATKRPSLPAAFAKRLADVEALARSNRKELDLQFQRIAQMQAQMDHIQRAWRELKKS